jgi:N-acetylglutamate synthase-like GNAT family acetyltransferase
MTSSVQVRIAELEDAERITSVINSAFRLAEQFFIDDARIDVESVRNFLNTGNFLLVERESVLVGCVYVEPRANRAYLGLLAVDPARQQSGLGSALMDAAEDVCRGLSCHSMDIKVVNLRTDLFGFYQRRGYVETGTSPFPTDVETKLPVHFIDMSKPLRPPTRLSTDSADKKTRKQVQ